MKSYKDYVMETCGGWGWDQAAADAAADVRDRQRRLFDSYYPLSGVLAAREIEVAWVDCLVFFLMGMKEGK